MPGQAAYQLQMDVYIGLIASASKVGLQMQHSVTYNACDLHRQYAECVTKLGLGMP